MATISEPAAKPSRDPWNAEARWLRWLTLIWLVLGLLMLFSASYPVAQRITGSGLTFDTPGSEQDALARYLRQIGVFTQADTPPAQDTRIQNLSARPDTVLQGL